MQQIATKQAITTEQGQLIEAMLTARTTTEAAKFCGINRTTVWRWQQETAFQAALATAQKRCLEEISNRVIAAAQKSLDVVIDIRDAGTNGDAVRLRAAMGILEMARIMLENAQISAQLAELTRMVEEN